MESRRGSWVRIAVIGVMAITGLVAWPSTAHAVTLPTPTVLADAHVNNLPPEPIVTVIFDIEGQLPTPPFGMVTVRDGATVVGSVQWNGHQMSTGVDLLPGAHTLVVDYTGDAANGPGSSDPIEVLVPKIATGATVWSPQAAGPFTCPPESPPDCTPVVVVGQPIDLMVNLNRQWWRSPALVPTGTVTIFDNNQPVVTIAAQGDMTTWRMTAGTTGWHSFTATYSGDDYFLASTLKDGISYLEVIATAKPPAAPLYVNADAGNGWVRASWSPGNPNGSPIVAFGVLAVDTVTHQTKWQRVSPDVIQGSIAGLVNGRAYDVYVVAWNAKGMGTFPAARRVTPSASGTDAKRPRAAASSYAQRILGNLTSIDVHWAPSINDRGSPIVGYSVVTMQSGRVVSWINKSPDDRQTTVTGMPTGSATTVTVLPLNAVGYSTEAPAMTVADTPPPVLATTG